MRSVLVAIFAIAALVNPRPWAERIEFALGIWLVISPFVLLFYANENGAAWNTIIVGLLIRTDEIRVLAQQSAPARTA